jgi:FkbM family methyltransferase
MKVVQIGTNRAFDDLSNYLINNYESIEFGLFVEPNILHIDSIKECYKKYNNINIENIAVKIPSYKENNIKIYYHTKDTNYEISSCNINHIISHIFWAGSSLIGGEIKSFTVPCMTLEKLFDKYSISELDWLYLDIEGIDAEILLTFNWEKYKIKRIEFEHLHLGEKSNIIYDMMISMGYNKVDSLHQNDWAFEIKKLT